jgi:hypothetical protein
LIDKAGRLTSSKGWCWKNFHPSSESKAYADI